MGDRKKESGDVVNATCHEEIPSRSSLDKVRKSELIDRLVGALERVNSQLDLLALRDAKISGLETRVADLLKERDAFKVVADNADDAIGDIRKSLEAARGEISIAQKNLAANKLLMEELSGQLKLAQVMYERDVKALQGELDKLRGRGFWQRLFNKG